MKNKSELLEDIYMYLFKERYVDNKKDMALKMGYNYTNLSSAFKGNERYLTDSFFEKINKTFGDLFNSNWIASGEGSMLNTLNSDNAKPLTEFPFLNIPFVPIHAQGGYGKGYGDVEYIDNLPTIPVIVDKNYRGKYRVFEVDGDSMDDGTRNALYDGDKILCREVKPELWSSKLHINKWFFVICMKNDGITVKQITSHEVETGVITCHPLNPLFDDFEVNLNEVAELYNVIKIVDRNTRI